MHHLCLSLHISIKLLSEARLALCACVCVGLHAGALVLLRPRNVFFFYTVTPEASRNRRTCTHPLFLQLQSLVWLALDGCVLNLQVCVCLAVPSFLIYKGAAIKVNHFWKEITKYTLSVFSYFHCKGKI